MIFIIDNLFIVTYLELQKNRCAIIQTFAIFLENIGNPYQQSMYINQRFVVYHMLYINIFLLFIYIIN